jgi:hypothetical protein
VPGEFVGKGWASEDAAALPTRWEATGEGLDGILICSTAPSSRPAI